MLAAILRTTRANLRNRPWQSLLAGLIVAAAAATMTLALDVRRGADAPFDRIFNATVGAHVVAATPEAQKPLLQRVMHLPGVIGTSPVERFGVAPGRVHGDPTELLVSERRSNDVAADRLLLRSGRFPSAPGEVLLERTFARSLHLDAGGQIVARGRTLRVVGTA